MSALAIGAHRRRRLLLHGLPRQKVLRLRRLAGRLWRSRRRWNHGRAASPACFASGAINAVFGKNAAGIPLPAGAIDGNWHQVVNQSIGMGIGWALAIVGTLVLLFLVDKTMGMRVSAADEAPGSRPLPARRGRLRL